VAPDQLEVYLSISRSIEYVLAVVAPLCEVLRQSGTTMRA